MKKSYVKPEVTLVRFELSEAIASCGTKVYKNYASYDECGGYSDEMQEIVDGMAKVGITVNFSEDSCTVPLKTYCYYTSTHMLMNS